MVEPSFLLGSPMGSFVIKMLSVVCTLGLIILVHEFGHFAFAKLFHMRVRSFSIGLPVGRPLYAWTSGGTKYGVWPFLFFGGVDIVGIHPDDDPNEAGSFHTRPAWQRMIVLGAGAGMNVVLALVLFWIMGFAYGLQVENTSEIEVISPGSPAHQAGLLPGDKIIGVNDVRTEDVASIRDLIEAHPEQSIRLTLQRGGEEIQVALVPYSEKVKAVAEQDGQIKIVDKTVGRVGIGFRSIHVKKGFFETLRIGILKTLALLLETIWGIVLIVTRGLWTIVGGPVMIVKEISQTSQLGLESLMFETARFSIMIGLFNVILPIPGLDCARLLFVFWEFLSRRPVDRRKEAHIHLVGVLFLLSLLLVLTVKDLRELIFG